MVEYPEYIDALFQKASYPWSNRNFEKELGSVLSDSRKKNEILDTFYESFWIPDLIKKWESLIDKERYNYFYSYIDKCIKSNIEKNIEKLFRREYVAEVDYFKSVVEESLNLLKIFRENSQNLNYIEIFKRQDLGTLSLGVADFILIFYEEWEEFFEEFSEWRKMEAMKIELKRLDLGEDANITDVSKRLFDKFGNRNAQINFRWKNLYTYRISKREDIMSQYEWKPYLNIPELKSKLLSSLD